MGDWRRKDCKRNATDAEDNAMTDQMTKVLRRARRNRVAAGVCGGLEEFFGISAFWFRLAFLIALLPGGVPGFALYVLLWLVMPSGAGLTPLPLSRSALRLRSAPPFDLTQGAA